MHALITGASAGIGEGFARRFAKNGWKLSLVARREEQLRALADDLAPECFVRPADLSDPAVAATVLAECEDALGPVDILVNNAGIQYVEPTEGVSLERIQRMMNVNVVTPLAFIRAVLPGMKGRSSGTIVNVTSMAGLTFTPGMCHYNGSKAALSACSESLRVELKGSGVHVLTVYPGPVTTEMATAALERYGSSLVTDHVPTGTTDELAKRVERAILSTKPRVIYPRIYGVARHTRVLSQWVTDLLAPSVGEG